MSVSIKCTTYFILILAVLSSCTQRSEEVTAIPNDIQTVLNLDTIKLPPPFKAKYIDPDSVLPPVVVPLKRQPKVVPAHANEYLAGTPEIIQIPKDLMVVTLGKDVPAPGIIPAKGNVVPALLPKPKPIKAFRTKDAAIYNIQFLSDEQGIYNNVSCMLEDSRGHLWFGNNGYIARYDGINYFVYSEKEGFFSGGAGSMIEDSKGNIWFAGEGGLCYYDGFNFVHFSKENGLESNNSRALKEDSKGNIWFSNGTNSVYCFDGKNFTVFNVLQQQLSNDSKKEQQFFSDNRVEDIEEDSNGHIWMATHGSGVLRYDGLQITRFTEKEGLVHNYIIDILEDNDGQLWFGSGGQGTRGRGVSRYNPNEGVNGSFSNFTKKEGLSGNRIAGMAKDKSGNIYLTTYDGGLTKFDPEAYNGQGNFTHFTPDEGLSFQSTLCIMLDSKDNIWVGTNGGGISRFQPNSFRHFTEQQGLSKNWADPLIEDSQGNIWISTLYGGAIKYDGKDFTHYTEKEGLLQNSVMDILEDKKGNLWFSTRDKGLCRFDGKGFTNYTTKQGLIGNFVGRLYEDSKGQIWAANQGGITRINPGDGKITHFIDKERYGIGRAFIFEDSDQNLWFGGRGLVAKFGAEKDELTFSYNVDPIETKWVRNLVEDDKKNLWFGTNSSFTQVKKNGNEIENDLPQLTIGNGLPNTRIMSLVVDKSQNIWVVCVGNGNGNGNGIAVLKNGLDVFGQLDVPWLHYKKEDGLIPSHFKNSFLDSKNRLWWGSLYGITQLNLNSFQLPDVVLQNLSLSHIDLQGQFLDFRNLKNEKYQNTLAFGAAAGESFDTVAAFENYPLDLNLPYDLNHLTFHFSAIDWVAPHQIHYSYKIDGVDQTWSESSIEAKADYRSLPYGTFTFEVKAIGAAQVWSEPFSYTFTISPPWWHTWWAYSLYAVLGIATIGGYVLRLRQKVKRKQEQLDREQNLNIELRELNIATSRFVPRDFIQILNKENLKELKLGDQTEATMTVLFADIRDYTSISEKMTPEKNFEFINDYLGQMGPIIQKHGGFICQYTGDGFMALFKEKHNLALEAANEMQKALQVYNGKSLVQDRPVIKVGIGLNTGKLMLGVIGDEQRFDTTVISDAVNTASRIEGLTKIFGCAVIASETTLIQSQILAGNGNDNFLEEEFRYLGKVNVKGKEKILKIYDFYGGESAEIRRIKIETKNAFEKAIQLYYGQEFGKAAELFKVIIGKYPDDVATQYYMDKSVEYIIDGVDEKWSGVERMVNK